MPYTTLFESLWQATAAIGNMKHSGFLCNVIIKAKALFLRKPTGK
jgi:hypothetical protein